MHGTDKMTAMMLNMLERDGDEEDKVSLALASIGKRIKKSLKEGEVDAIIDKLNEEVGYHIHAARGGRVMITYNTPATSTSATCLATGPTGSNQLPSDAFAPEDGQ